MTTSKSLLQDFDAVDKYLDAVRETVRDGYMPDIQGLDAIISDLCMGVRKAEPEIQERCLEKLDDLLYKLDECHNEMSALQAEKLRVGTK